MAASAPVTDGTDDRLTTTRQLVAILSLNVRPNGRVNGTLRHESLSYRFSSLSALPATVARALVEALGPPVVVDEPARPSTGDLSDAGRSDEE
jgi:hypothetical protein